MEFKWPTVKELIGSSKQEIGIAEIFVRNGAEKLRNGEILTNPPPIELIRFFNLEQ
jgi:hypothetical protein